MQVRTKILFLPFKVLNKVAVNALSPLVFLLQLKFEVLEKNVLQRLDDKKGRECAQKNLESLKTFLRKSKIIDYADAVCLTGNFLCKEVPCWEGVFIFCDYETEVIAV